MYQHELTRAKRLNRIGGVRLEWTEEKAGGSRATDLSPTPFADFPIHPMGTKHHSVSLLIAIA